MKCFTAQNRELLIECLETEKAITNMNADKLINSGIYEYYCYDQRIKAHRYLINDIPNNLGLPQWLHIYEDENN